MKQQRTPRRWVVLLGVLSVLAIGAWCSPALALEPTDQWEGSIDYGATGGTFLEDRCQATVFGCLPGKFDEQGDAVSSNSSASLCGIPENASLVKATLIWMGSLGPDGKPDDSVKLQPPQGVATVVKAKESDLAQTQYEGKDVNDNPATFKYYTYRVDVTDILRVHSVTNRLPLNGEYSISDYQGYADEPYRLMKAALGGWSIFIVYSVPSASPKRIYYYTDFRAVRDSVLMLTPSGFVAPVNAQAKATFFVGEGDPEIAGQGTASHPEELRVENALLTDACNPSNNPYNSSINTNLCPADGGCRKKQFSVDLDTFPITMRNGATDLNVQMSVGQDLILPNFILLSISSKAPDFDIPNEPEKSSLPKPGTSLIPGQQVTYYIYIQNAGEDVASDVRLRDDLPADVTYVPGSTYLTEPNGERKQIPDLTGGLYPLTSPINIAENMLPGRDYRRTVEFKATLNSVAQGVSKDTIVQNIGEIISGNGNTYFTNGGEAVRHSVRLEGTEGKLYISPGPHNPGNRFVSAGKKDLVFSQVHLKVTDGRVDLLSMRFVASEGMDGSLISKASLYVDKNGDGALDSGDVLLGSSVTPEARAVTFNQFSSISPLEVGTETDLLWVVDIADNAAVGKALSYTLLADNVNLLGFKFGLPFETPTITIPDPTQVALAIERGASSMATSTQKPGTSVAALQLTATSYSDSVVLSSLTVRAEGSLYDPTEISGISLYLDSNNNGRVDSGETKLGEGTFADDDGSVTFDGLSQSIPSGNAKSFVFQVDLAAAASLGSSFSLTIADNSDVVLSDSTKQVVGAPVLGNTITIQENSSTCLIDADCQELGDNYVCDVVNGVCVEGSAEDGDETVDGDNDTIIPPKKKSSGCQIASGASFGLLALLSALTLLAVVRRKQRG